MSRALPISVCMIVRNEQINLPAALESVRRVAAELVVVDTGSDDRSVEIARAAGARVLQIPWQDDFSLARNVALRAARQDWILSLDADQRLDPATVPALATAVTRRCQAQIVTIDIAGGEPAGGAGSSYTALRLFRRDARIRYSGRVHEDVAESLLAMGSSDWPDSGVALIDLGYGDAQQRQAKRNRNLVLLERAHADQPDDLYIAYKLGITLPPQRAEQRRALLCSAIDAARGRGLDDQRGLPFLPRLLAAAIDACVHDGRLCEAADMAQSLLPALGASCFFSAGRAVARTGQAALARELLTHFLAIGPRHPNLAVQADPEADGAQACLWLAWLARTAGDLVEAQTWLQRARELAAENAAPLLEADIECEAIRVRLAAGDIAGAGLALDRLYPMAQGGGAAYAEVMLVSAELSLAAGDRAGALQLAQAALTPDDDRAAALLATLELQDGQLTDQRLRQLLKAVTGLRFDTLAVRSALAQRLGLQLGFDLPAATSAQVALIDAKKTRR
jgi:hypothetical protein